MKKLMNSKKVCPDCSNKRFFVHNNAPVRCGTCNSDGKYKIKEIEVCLGCGKDIDRDCGCPAGTCMRILPQD